MPVRFGSQWPTFAAGSARVQALPRLESQSTTLGMQAVLVHGHLDSLKDSLVPDSVSTGLYLCYHSGKLLSGRWFMDVDHLRAHFYRQRLEVTLGLSSELKSDHRENRVPPLSYQLEILDIFHELQATNARFLIWRKQKSAGEERVRKRKSEFSLRE